MTSDTIHIDGNQQHAHSLSELSMLKIIALVLLIFVHSDLVIAYPKVMYPIQWFLLSVFFFIGGYLAYSSFTKRGKSLKQFFKNKALTLYVPFFIAVLFYLDLEVIMGVQLNPMNAFSWLSMLNVFDQVNSANNWGTLWFIPFLLLFMGITCLLERYVKSTKRQLLSISALLAFTTIFWLYETPLKLDSLFSQYLLVFVFGFYISKFGLYQKIVNPKMALVAVPLVAFFAFDFSGYFNYNTVLDALQAQIYFNCRSVLLTMGMVILALMVLRRIRMPVRGIGKQISDHSALIYLYEPFVSFIILNYGFGQGGALFANGLMFYLYQATRITVLLVIIPFGLLVWSHRKNLPNLSTLLKSQL
jgi:hypothetical protein